MRLSSAAFSALLVAAASSISTAAAEAAASTAAAVFSPPAVFKNTNLVHVVAADKAYVKETINVQVENIDKSPQDDYYLPFAADRFAHVGGFEAKDRKDSAAAPFQAEAVTVPDSDIQYYRIRFHKPLDPGQQITLGIVYYVLDSYRPLPALIVQDEKQYLVYGFSAYCPSAYVTEKQKTEVKFASSDVPDYTKLPAGTAGAKDEQPQKMGAKLTYGPFTEAQPAGATLPVEVRFEFTKPVNHVSRLEREIEVSHWGGNVAFEEHYALVNRGANLSTLFNRVKWAQTQYYNPPSPALREMRFPLRAGSVDAYYTDVIGNVSTSRFRANKRESVLEIKPRYPVFGGWQFPFTVGWNADAKRFLRAGTSSRNYVLNVPFLEGPKQQEGVAYEQVSLRILLPEGAANVKYSTTIPASSIVESGVSLYKTYLDTIGRTAVVIEARNLADEFRDREVVVSYDYSLLASLRKPLVVFGSTLSVFVAMWLIGRVNLKFSKN